MARQKGATSTDKAAHQFFYAACTFNIGGRNHGHRCPRCNATLLTAYHEERLYSVYCPACSTVSLVTAGSPYNAEQQVGLPAGSQAESDYDMALLREYAGRKT